MGYTIKPAREKERRNFMAEFVNFKKTESLHRFLNPGESATIQFKPLDGPVTARALAVEEGDGTISGKLPDHHLPEGKESGPGFSVKQNAKIEVSLNPKDKAPVIKKILQTKDALEDDPSEELRFDIPKGQSDVWECKFRNVGEKEVKLIGGIRFTAERRTLFTTAIPIRLLNSALRHAIDALGLRVRLNGSNSFIDFSDELKEISGGALKRESFSAEWFGGLISLKDINLQTLSCRILPGPPAVIRVFIDFEEKGKEIDTVLGGLDIENTSITIDFTMIVVDDPLQLGGTGNPRTLAISAKARTNARIIGNFLVDVLEKHVVRLAERLQSEIERATGSHVFRDATTRYLTAAFIELAERGQILHDLQATERSLLVKHHKPKATPGNVASPGEFELSPIATSSVDVKPNVPGTASAGFPPKAVNPVGPIINKETLEKVLQQANLEQKVDHIVVLMQENRSFDNMLGYLTVKEGRKDVDGLTGKESNGFPGLKPAIVNPLKDTLFPFSPHHGHQQVLKQIADGNMSGFLASFIDKFSPVDPDIAMGYYTKDQVTTYDFFAKNFVICDRWFCSFPGGTQPNRFCTLSGTTPVLNNFEHTELGYLKVPTIFEILSAVGVSWNYFEQDIAFLRMLDRYRLDDRNVLPFFENVPGYDSEESFLVKARRGKLPAVSFVDPNFVDIPPTRAANDDHAPADIKMGQANIACIYDALVKSPKWEKTLFCITYDEHGGFYDHVPPPGTKASTEKIEVPKVHPEAPGFLGVRVPTFVISPWVPQGAVSHMIFDHTAILKTIIKRFVKPGFDFGPRVEQAQHLGRLLTESKPRLNVPTFGTSCLPKPPRVGGITPSVQADFEDFHEVMKRFGRPKFPNL
jgi:phospholipase C